jgi:hypothetical protein
MKKQLQILANKYPKQLFFITRKVESVNDPTPYFTHVIVSTTVTTDSEVHITGSAKLAVAYRNKNLAQEAKVNDFNSPEPFYYGELDREYDILKYSIEYYSTKLTMAIKDKKNPFFINLLKIQLAKSEHQLRQLMLNYQI